MDHVTSEVNMHSYKQVVCKFLREEEQHKENVSEDEWLSLSQTLATTAASAATTTTNSLQTSSSPPQHSARRRPLLRPPLLLPLRLRAPTPFPTVSSPPASARDAPNRSRGCHQPGPRRGGVADCQRHLPRHWSPPLVTGYLAGNKHQRLVLINNTLIVSATMREAILS